MIPTVDSNIILRSIIDSTCSECFVKFYFNKRSFLCYTVNREVKKKQEKINSFLEELLYRLEETNKDMSDIKKMNFFQKFSKQFEEIFDSFKEASQGFQNIAKLKKIAKEKSEQQRNYLIMRESMSEKRLWPRISEKTEEILQKKEIDKKRKKIKNKIPMDDSQHLVIANYYGNNKAYEEVLFISADINHIIKNRDLIEETFDILKINSPNEFIN